ncbi:hypothetical protein JIQ42_07789 [Leishmania sp. Namibia]|uniref:hypothetical protein n=1 Tax=Leishmania sp. Namibia TaxID=2802991 RepID=UPI001B48E30C|nr:hypothetical protein JIQ42_07789 [Leishmania sp. Namibia]
MDVKIGTIISRFAFTLPGLGDDSQDSCDAIVPSSDDEGAENSRGVTSTSATPCTATPASATVTRIGARSHLRRSGASSSETEMLGATGAYAFVRDGGASSSASLVASSSSCILGRGDSRISGSDITAATMQRGGGDRRGGVMKRGALLCVPDLVQLAMRAWNVELWRGPKGAASHCILRLPPFADGTALYRGPVAYVLASGIVRMVTYGSVAATEVLARRVRDALHEACKPLAVRRAAREESCLLQAVLGDSLSGMLSYEDNGENCARRLCTDAPHSEMRLSSGGMALATALAGEATTSDRHGRKAALLSSPAAASTRSLAGGSEGCGPPTLSEKACTIDFVQAVATPRWDAIAGLRASLFAPTSASLGQGDGSGAIVADVDQVAEEAPRASVRRASVNVRGDAPMEWWRWYLGVQAGDCSVGGGDFGEVPLPGSSLPKAGWSVDATNGGHTSARSPNKTTRFQTCAGYADASPTSAENFVRFLQRRRELLAHHITSFKLRRQATQNSLQILMDWRTATPLPSPAPLSAAAPSAAVLVAERPLSAEALVVGKPRRETGPPPDSGTPPPPAALTRVSSGTTWVTEASAANFFMESTFIAESTTPHGLESVRMPWEKASPADPARWASRTSGGERAENAAGSTALRWDSSRDTQSVLHGDNSSIEGGTSTTKVAPAKRKREAAAIRTVAAKRDGEATAAVEHVTCIIHRTGRVQMTAASELALRQMCALLLIPFLVATAEVEL